MHGDGNVGSQKSLCERDAEIDELAKDVEKLKDIPQQVCVLTSEVGHITKAVDTMCTEVRKLTETIQQLALVQQKQDTLKEEVAKLLLELKESNRKMDGCTGRCLTDMNAVNNRITKVSERVTDLERIVGIIKWAAAIIGATFLVSGVYFIWTLVMHVYRV